MKPDKSNALRVVVKGDKFAAARAASERGIPFVFVREVRRHGNVQTVGWIPKAFRDKAAEWLTAPPLQPPIPGRCSASVLTSAPPSASGPLPARGHHGLLTKG